MTASAATDHPNQTYFKIVLFVTLNNVSLILEVCQFPSKHRNQTMVSRELAFEGTLGGDTTALYHDCDGVIWLRARPAAS